MLKQSEIISSPEVQSETAKLIKSITTLSNLVLIYLTITWGYLGLEFILRSIFT
jgi:hypothetical protein